MINQPLILDGSQGEGGGQILRTSLALSMVTRTPFRLENVRAGREKPGLMRQHLTAVQAAAKICDARVDGAAIGSRTLEFHPGEIKPGTYTFSVGSAGSGTLVLQTVLPGLLCARAPSSLTIEGGTHNPFAPPLDFLELAFIPVINRMGPKVHIAMERAGFYPAGGGRFFVNIEPASKLMAFDLHDRGEIDRRLARALVAALPGDIGLRELAMVRKHLHWTDEECQIRQLPAEWGPGNILLLEIRSQHITELLTAFGMKGVTAEAVAQNAIDQAREYLAANVPVGPYLADQLLLPLALAGAGSFTTIAPTQHTRTNAKVIEQFLEVRITLEEVTSKQWRVACHR